MSESRIDWSGPIQAGIVAAIILGANLPFYFLHRSDMKGLEGNILALEEKTDRKIDAIRIEIREEVGAIRQDIRNLHEQMIRIEERQKI